MDIRLIGTEADYEQALVEIKRLWGAPPGTAERDRLEILAMLAHRYEREREPCLTSHRWTPSSFGWSSSSSPGRIFSPSSARRHVRRKC